MRSGNGKGTGGIARIIGILVVIYILTSMFSGGDGGLVSLLFRLLGFFFWGGFLLLVLCLALPRRSFTSLSGTTSIVSRMIRPV